MLRGMDAGQYKVFSSTNAVQNYAIVYAELSEKLTVFKKHLLLKRYFF